MNERIKWITHKGKEILFMDFSSLSSDEMVKVILDVEKYYESDIIPQGKKDLLLLSDITEARVFGDSLNETKRVVKKFRPYSKKSAMVGLSAAKTVLLATINFFAGETKASKPFATIEEAKDYLVE
jgi:hypothetical protein